MYNQRALYQKSMGINTEVHNIGDDFTVFRILQAINRVSDLKDLNSAYGYENIIQSYIDKLNSIEDKWKADEL
jgi:hypothetical protein